MIKGEIVMKGQLTVIKTNGDIVCTELTSTPNLKMLQKAVGGYIETIPFFEKYEGKPCVAFCNEESKLKGLKPNHTATELWDKNGYSGYDHIVGDIAIITGDQDLLGAL
jgi:hypothetical protein